MNHCTKTPGFSFPPVALVRLGSVWKKFYLGKKDGQPVFCFVDPLDGEYVMMGNAETSNHIEALIAEYGESKVRPCPQGSFLQAAVIQSIHDDVQRNDHNEAYRTAAIALGQVDLAEQFAAISKKQMAMGYMTSEQIGQRDALYHELLDRAKAILAPLDYRAFYSAT